MTTAIAGFVASHVGTALTYICCLRTNVHDLTDAAKELEDVQADLQVKVDEANRSGEQILNQVEAWIEKVASAQVNAQDIFVNQNPGIFNLKSRYIMSKRAKETAESMNKLRDACSFVRVSSRALPASMGQLTPPLRQTKGIESRKKTEEDIMMALRDEKVYVIGIWGMGGVGKTTIAKKIMHRAKEDEHLFDEVLLVPVGQKGDLMKIQHDIADWLDFKLEAKTLGKGATRLRARLEGGNRKLIIIDDVWERVNLEELGIPCQSGSCTTLLTSRDKSILNAHTVFTIQILSDEEAWLMFKENVGACLDDPKLLPIAKEVAKECKGLPLALVVVSQALKGQVKVPIWLDALKQLKSSNPIDILYVIKDVYNPIRLSYDFLENQQAKSLLCLCASFPDDHEISLEYLALYGFGLCILGDDIDNLEDTRNRIAGLVDTLKKRFLILDGKEEHYVKMHDVVRDVAIFIASKDNKAILEFTSLDRLKQNPHCNMLLVIQKLSEFDVFSTGLTFPKLTFLLWMNESGFGYHPMTDNFFRSMLQLRVLSISYFSFAITQQNMILLKNLRTLHLYSCILETLSAVGELSSLEILYFHSCPFVTELPEEIGRLHCLRLLEVTNCSGLKKIVPGVISRLGQLEELKMVDSFKGWELDGIENERSNASLAELQSLSKLTCLEIEIEVWPLDARVLQFSSKLVKYNIQVGEKSKREPSSANHEKKLYVNLPMCKTLINWIDMFSRTAEYLCLEGFDSNGFDFSGLQNIRCLVFENCRTVVKLVSFVSTYWGLDVFPVLEELYLHCLPMLEEICDDLIQDGSNSFAELKKLSLTNLDRLLQVWRSKIELRNLCTLRVWSCRKLRRVFSSSVVVRSLSQLETLEVEYCESVEEVFWIEFEEKDDGNTSSSCITFPKLKRLTLNQLGSLMCFCKGIDIIEFPQLDYLKINNCPKLTSFSNASSDHQHHVKMWGRDSVHIFCNTKITFGSLKRLSLRGFNNISYLWCRHIPNNFFGELENLDVYNIDDIENLFSCSIVANLVNLKHLTINGCGEMTYVVADDDGNAKTSWKKPLIMFPKLESLELRSLKRLRSFCEGIHDINIEFHRLVALIIESCPKLTRVNNNNHSDHVNSSPTHHHQLICYTKSTFESLHPFLGDLEVLDINQCNINHLFSYAIAVNLVNLKKLSISACKELAYLVAEDDPEPSETKSPVLIFHKLNELHLRYLPMLKNFCDGRWDLKLPSLKRLNIDECPVMENLTRGSISTPNLMYFSAQDSNHWFCNTKTFHNLKDVMIEGCENACADHIKHLFSYSMAGNLVNLETLSIYSCSEMVYVIADDDDNPQTSGKKPQIIFHKLHRVDFSYLPKLKNLCDWGWDVQFPLLGVLNIDECPGMEGVTLESVRKQNMEAVQSRLTRERPEGGVDY